MTGAPAAARLARPWCLGLRLHLQQHGRPALALALAGLGPSGGRAGAGRGPPRHGRLQARQAPAGGRDAQLQEQQRAQQVVRRPPLEQLAGEDVPRACPSAPGEFTLSRMVGTKQKNCTNKVICKLNAQTQCH